MGQLCPSNFVAFIGNYGGPPCTKGSSLSIPFHLREFALNASGDGSVFPASTLSPPSDCDSSSDLMSSLLEDSVCCMSTLGHKSDLGPGSLNGTKSTGLGIWTPEMQDKRSPRWLNNAKLMPIASSSVYLPRSQTPSPGTSKMLLSLSDHAPERPCTPNASTLYKNTRIHCNPSDLGQQTYEECMVSEIKLIVRSGGQGWRNGESTCLQAT